MPSWHSILEEIRTRGSTHDVVRRAYLSKLHRLTGRNVIVYYSGWLQKPGIQGSHVQDADKNGFMTAIHELDRSKGLDLILHTPGGETAATESLVDYLHAMFGTNIRAVVPQIALSAGTMIACACREILMGLIIMIVATIFSISRAGIMSLAASLPMASSRSSSGPTQKSRPTPRRSQCGNPSSRNMHPRWSVSARRRSNGPST